MTSKLNSTDRRRNVRSLDEIADGIHKLERANIIDIGDHLLEANLQCEHGDWLAWLESEFEWSDDTARRFMKVAKLSAKFRTLRNLKLAVTVLYDLLDEDEEELPAIVAELTKHATKTRLKRSDAWDVINVGKGRRRFGDYPDPTLLKLLELEDYKDKAWHEKAVAALLEREPTDDDQAHAIVDEIKQEYTEAEDSAVTEPPVDTTCQRDEDRPVASLREPANVAGSASAPPATETEVTEAEQPQGVSDDAHISWAVEKFRKGMMWKPMREIMLEIMRKTNPALRSELTVELQEEFGEIIQETIAALRNLSRAAE